MTYVDSVSYAGATTTGFATADPSLTCVSAASSAVSLATGAVNGQENQEFAAARMSQTKEPEHVRHMVRNGRDRSEPHRHLGAHALRVDRVAVSDLTFML